MATIINKTTLGFATGVAAASFLIGYCVYFDKKRRSDPDYKKKVHERRARQRKDAEAAARSGMPDPSDCEAVQRYFVQEIHLGESLIANGEFEMGVAHLANALMVCGRTGRMLDVLQTTLPIPVYKLLLSKVQQMNSSIMEAQIESAPTPHQTVVPNDDLE